MGSARFLLIPERGNYMDKEKEGTETTQPDGKKKFAPKRRVLVVLAIAVLACLTAGIGLSACSDGDEGGGIRDTNPTNPSNSNRSILKPGR